MERGSIARKSVGGRQGICNLARRIRPLYLSRKQNRFHQGPTLAQDAQHVLQRSSSQAGDDPQSSRHVRYRPLARRFEQTLSGQPFFQRLELCVKLPAARRPDLVCIELVTAALRIDANVTVRQNLISYSGEPGVAVDAAPPHHRGDNRTSVLQTEIDMPAGRLLPTADLSRNPDIPEQVILFK